MSEIRDWLREQDRERRAERAEKYPFVIDDVSHERYLISFNGYDDELSNIRSADYRRKYHGSYDIESMQMEIGYGEEDFVGMGYFYMYDPSPAGVGLRPGYMTDWDDISADFSQLAEAMIADIDSGRMLIDEEYTNDIADKLDSYLGREPHRVAEAEAEESDVEEEYETQSDQILRDRVNQGLLDVVYGANFENEQGGFAVEECE